MSVTNVCRSTLFFPWCAVRFCVGSFLCYVDDCHTCFGERFGINGGVTNAKFWICSIGPGSVEVWFGRAAGGVDRASAVTGSVGILFDLEKGQLLFVRMILFVETNHAILRTGGDGQAASVDVRAILIEHEAFSCGACIAFLISVQY